VSYIICGCLCFEVIICPSFIIQFFISFNRNQRAFTPTSQCFRRYYTQQSSSPVSHQQHQPASENSPLTTCTFLYQMASQPPAKIKPSKSSFKVHKHSSTDSPRLLLMSFSTWHSTKWSSTPISKPRRRQKPPTHRSQRTLRSRLLHRTSLQPHQQSRRLRSGLRPRIRARRPQLHRRTRRTAFTKCKWRLEPLQSRPHPAVQVQLSCYRFPICD
jgi:hypothetical protein